MCVWRTEQGIRVSCRVTEEVVMLGRARGRRELGDKQGKVASGQQKGASCSVKRRGGNVGETGVLCNIVELSGYAPPGKRDTQGHAGIPPRCCLAGKTCPEKRRSGCTGSAWSLPDRAVNAPEWSSKGLGHAIRVTMAAVYWYTPVCQLYVLFLPRP